MMKLKCPCCHRRFSLWQMIRALFCKPVNADVCLDERYEFGALRGGDIDG